MYRSSFLYSAILLALGSQAYAQEAGSAGDDTHTVAETKPEESKGEVTQLDTITVTAERRAQSLQKTALSISALQGDALQREGKTSIASMLEDVPAVVMQGTGTDGIPIIAIRGLGTDGNSQMPGTAIYLDGIPVSHAFFGFYDLDRVEVVRGPQGTLYGRGSPAGAVNFITRDPEKQLSSDLSFEVGNYSLFHATGVLNLPLGSAWAARLSFNSISRSGYLSNGQSDDKQNNARLKLKWDPGEDVSLLLGGEYYKNTGAGEGNVTLNADNQVTGLETSSPANAAWTDNSYEKVYARLEWQLGPVALTYIPSYQNFVWNTLNFLNGGINRVDGPRDALASHELRFSGGGDPDSIAWVAGLYYSRGDLSNDTSIAASTDIPANYFLTISNQQKSTSKAVFAEFTYPLAERTRVTLGGRMTRDKVSSWETDIGYGVLDVFPVGETVLDPQSAKFKRTDYKVRLERDVGRDSLLYASLTTGYRPGGFSGGAAYGQEVNKSFEIGSKNRWLDGRVNLNAALFHYDYSGFQSPIAVWLNDDPSTNVITRYRIENNPATFKGGEMELLIQPTANDRITLSPAYVDAKLATGYPVQHAPKWTLAGGYSHDFELADAALIRVGMDVKRQSWQYTNYNDPPLATTVQPAYLIGNLQLSYLPANGKYSVSGYVHNVTNELVKLTVNGSNAQISAPRTFGVVVTVHL